MKRYDIDGDCDGGHIAADMSYDESECGDWVRWDDVEDILLDVLVACSLEEAKNFIRPHISDQYGGDKT